MSYKQENDPQNNASWQVQPVCPEDLYERMIALHHQPEAYDHLVAKQLQALCNAISGGTITWIDGVPYSNDPSRSKMLSLNRPTITSAYYGLNQSSRYLRVDGVTTAGSQGFLCPRKGTITGLWAKSRSTGNWTVEVRKNGSPITLVSVPILSSFGSNMVIDVDTDAGDYLQFYLSGSGIDHPIAAMEMAWRP